MNNTLCILLMVVLGLPAVFQPFAAPAMPVQEKPQFYFKCQAPVKQANDQFSRTLELVGPPRVMDTARVFYTQSGTDRLFKAVLDQGRVVIVSSCRAFYKVYAVAGKIDHPMTAATSFYLWGSSKAPAPRLPAAVQEADEFKGMLFLGVDMFKTRFWPQTGETFCFFLYRGLGTDPATQDVPVNVLEKGKIRPLKPGKGPSWIHVPVYDRDLNRAGATAFREDIVFADFIQGSDSSATHQICTYTFMVHRSRFAQNSAKAGWMVFGGTLVVFAGWIMIKRRQPWWRG